MSKLTIDEILLWWQGQRSVEEHHAKYEEAKQQLTDLINDIIGEDERKTRDGDTTWMGAYLKGRQDLKDEQRQRAKERGIGL